ncbi:MAG TPA: precorrin-4 C(11)-methyltransferase [Thermodesulfobacteriota bacterium]|nr:precorrin-4 C(11)-methyltransferase [Thermodesulfobacteriota bacterium]
MKVYFIGAGPGDPELLTLKGRRILETSDVVIYAGSLINPKILKFARLDAVLHDSSTMELEEILGIYREAKKAERTVARIHTGDLSIYSALQEQLDACEKEGIDCEIVPGVSSYQAAAAALRRELTLPGVSQTLILTRISGRTQVPARENLGELAKAQATLVIFLSVHEIDRVVEQLVKGYGEETPVAVVEKASWPEERKIIGTLGSIAAKVKEAGIKRHALIIVGEALKKKYQKSKLYDAGFEHGFRKKKSP